MAEEGLEDEERAGVSKDCRLPPPPPLRLLRLLRLLLPLPLLLLLLPPAGSSLRPAAHLQQRSTR